MARFGTDCIYEDLQRNMVLRPMLPVADGRLRRTAIVFHGRLGARIQRGGRSGLTSSKCWGSRNSWHRYSCGCHTGAQTHQHSIGIWWLNANGSHPAQLTDGDWREEFPVCAGNQKWVYYFNDVQHIWRVPLDGSGKPEPIPGSAVPHAFLAGRGMGISPDEKTLAYLIEVLNPDGQSGIAKVALLDLTTLTSPRLLNADPRISSGVQFTPDGIAVAYNIRENGVDNIWIQPLDGPPGRQITKFDSEQILSVRWSPNGKNLGIVRGHTDSDVVLLQE